MTSTRGIALKPAVLLALAAPALLGVAPPPSPGPPDGVSVVVTYHQARSLKGMVRACMVHAAADFPDCTNAGDAYRANVPTGALQVRFAHVMPGRYAIALLHDENGNGKADRVLGMMPKEGFGFSRDAPLQMGPPKFAAAAFTVGEEPLTLSIRLRYLF
jgi:uncharacterized protein (DUF2141 family)